MAFICFGEILWDVFPDEKRLGGAPLNVAYYLSQLNNQVQLVSAIGDDMLGAEAIAQINEAGLDTQTVAKIANKETGQVLVNLDDHGSANYEFKADAAWDYIRAVPDNWRPDKNDTLIYGSLAARSSDNLELLQEMKSLSGTNIFDLNMRPPFDDLGVIEQLLDGADWIKMNEEELAKLCANAGVTGAYLEPQLTAIANRYNASTVCVTLGSEGAALWSNGERSDGKFYSHPGYPSQVVDTVGAGDAFLGGLISALHHQESPKDALAKACALGSMVAAQPGAHMKVRYEDIQQIVDQR